MYKLVFRNDTSTRAWFQNVFSCHARGGGRFSRLECLSRVLYKTAILNNIVTLSDYLKIYTRFFNIIAIKLDILVIYVFLYIYF